jgi:N-acyl-D-aspartate/D-glutamate deacylase
MRQKLPPGYQQRSFSCLGERMDLVIRGGAVFDGNGGLPFESDIGVCDGRIVKLGQITEAGAEEIDARGLIVTPGFIDAHTHYDGQAIWSDRLTPSSWHGVTTVVMGNCGVGFAPCRPQDRHRLVSLMEGIEDIPEVVLTQGLTWEWETFPQYLNAIERRPHDIDVAALLPHSALRVYVMGERGARREAATDEDMSRMAAIALEAVEAGALGFATSRLIFHKSTAGDIVPTFDADERELHAIASAFTKVKRGVLQIVEEFPVGGDTEAAFGLLRRMAAQSGRPLCFTLQQFNDRPDQWRQLLQLIERANADGIRIRGQFLPRSLGVIFGHLSSANPFGTSPTYKALQALPLEARIGELRKADVRRKILADPPDLTDPVVRLAQDYSRMFRVTDPPNYEPPADQSVAARAAAQDISPAEFIYDAMLKEEGRALWFVAFSNYADRTLGPAAVMLRNPYTLPALGDGGAHCGLITDASYPTHVLTHWTRDRHADRIKVQEAVRLLTRVPAETMGLNDRGVIAVGLKADLNIIDYDALRLHAPYVSYDLPAGGRRMNQRADGYEATIVSGQVIYRRGEATSALPGRLVRAA